MGGRPVGTASPFTISSNADIQINLASNLTGCALRLVAYGNGATAFQVGNIIVAQSTFQASVAMTKFKPQPRQKRVDA